MLMWCPPFFHIQVMWVQSFNATYLLRRSVLEFVVRSFECQRQSLRYSRTRPIKVTEGVYVGSYSDHIDVVSASYEHQWFRGALVKRCCSCIHEHNGAFVKQ